ncbi:hypothetical protein ACLI4Y_13965 [Natrialbaceae archaeon A-CW3]
MKFVRAVVSRRVERGRAGDPRRVHKSTKAVASTTMGCRLSLLERRRYRRGQLF